MIALLAALILSQNTPRHPAPATTDTVSVGDGTNWVSRAMPTCNSSTSALQYTPGGTFSCGTIAGSSTSISAVAPLTAVSDGGSGYTIGYTVSANQVYVGTGANALTAKTLPNCNAANSHLSFDNTTQTFSCVTNSAIPNVWSTFCPSGTTCTDNSLTFLSWYTPASGPIAAKAIECNATSPGSASGTVTMTVYDGTSNVGTCTIPCATGTTRTAASCNTAGFTMNSGTTYRLYMGTLAGGCVSVPSNIWCNLPLDATP